jgi:hypothetical protein
MMPHDLNYAIDRRRRRAWPPRLGRHLLFAGWLLWLASMPMEAATVNFGLTNNWSAVRTFWLALIMILSGLQTFYRSTSGTSFSAASRLLQPLLLLYPVAMLIVSGSACWRATRPWLWTWRVVSLALLIPWSFLIDPFTRHNPLHRTSGYGLIVWAVGSTLMALSVWVTSPRDAGQNQYARKSQYNMGSGNDTAV